MKRAPYFSILAFGIFLFLFGTVLSEVSDVWDGYVFRLPMSNIAWGPMSFNPYPRSVLEYVLPSFLFYMNLLGLAMILTGTTTYYLSYRKAKMRGEVMPKHRMIVWGSIVVILLSLFASAQIFTIGTGWGLVSMGGVSYSAADNKFQFVLTDNVRSLEIPIVTISGQGITGTSCTGSGLVPLNASGYSTTESCSPVGSPIKGYRYDFAIMLPLGQVIQGLSISGSAVYISAWTISE